GKVEGRDDADDAERVPAFEETMFRSLGMHLVAVQLPTEADAKVADVDDLLDFAASFAQDLAVFERDESGQVFLALPERVAQLPDDLATARCRYLTPPREGLCGGDYHRVVVVQAGCLDASQYPARRGVERLEELAASFDEASAARHA